MSEPRWLDEIEARAWRAWVECTGRVNRRLERQLRDDSGLTFDDYEVLVRLSEAPGRRLRMSDLAARAIQSPSRLSQRIDRLAERGLVRRERTAEDRRVVFAVLTTEGFAVLEAAAPGHVEAVREVLIDRFDRDELVCLGEVLGRLADQLGAEDGAERGEPVTGSAGSGAP